MPARQEKTVSDSRIIMHQLMMPEHANALGNVHGGHVMKLVDEAGGIAAMRHAQRPCVTVAMDSMTFRSPVHVGELMSCEAFVTFVGHSSVEVHVIVRAENPISGATTHTNSATLVYVALDDAGRPCEVPRLRLEREDERLRWREAERRQEQRLAETRRGSSG